MMGSTLSTVTHIDSTTVGFSSWSRTVPPPPPRRRAAVAYPCHKQTPKREGSIMSRDILTRHAIRKSGGQSREIIEQSGALRRARSSGRDWSARRVNIVQPRREMTYARVLISVMEERGQLRNHRDRLPGSLA